MPNRIEELFAELAESAGGQQQFQIDQQLRQQEAERELYDTDEARTALKIMGGLLTLGIPLPGMRALGLGKLGSQVPGLNKLYGAVGGDMAKQAIKNKQPVFEFSKKINDYVRRQKNADEKMMFEKMSIRNRIKNDPPLSGSRVGTDVAGRVPLPTAKPPVTTIRGPRGPINIGQPPAGPPRPAPPKGTRNTSGISDAERAQLPQTGGGITATKAADKIHAQIAKREKWLKSAKDNYKRSDDAFQEGVRSGYQPDIKAGSKGVEKFGNRIAQLEKEIADLLKSLE